MDDAGSPWAGLFADLESQLAAADAVEVAAETTQRIRRELLSGEFSERVRGALGRSVAVGVSGAGPVNGLVADAGPDWLLLTVGGDDVLVASAAVLWITGAGRTAVAGQLTGAVASRWTFRLAVRALVEQRAAVQVVLTDATACSGTLARAGADYLELTEHPVGEFPRPGSVSGQRLIPLAAVALVRSRR